MTYKKTDKNNITTDMTPEEVIEHDKFFTMTKKILEENKKEIADAKSGNAKLLNLGLTQAEATALTGYTPSEEVEE
jgi:hypothetical protein